MKKMTRPTTSIRPPRMYSQCMIVLFRGLFVLNDKLAVLRKYSSRKSSGSFFTTWNASFFWLNAAILFAAKSKKLDKN